MKGFLERLNFVTDKKLKKTMGSCQALHLIFENFAN